MTSMAATLAASLPSLPAAKLATPQAPTPAKVPQRMEGVVDPEASRDVESIQLNSLVLLKMMKHSTDVLPPPAQASYQQDRNAPPQTTLSSHTDAVGVLLGLDLEGVLEVEDCFGLPSGEVGVGCMSSLGQEMIPSYTTRLLSHLSESQTPDSPIGIYLSTHNGGFITRPIIELLQSVEKMTSRGKAVLVVHDKSRGVGGDLSVKGWRLSEGVREALKGGKWDSQTLIENKITPSNMLTPLPIALSSPTLLNTLLTTLSIPSTPSPSTLKSPLIPLPKTFSPLLNPLPTSLPTYLTSTLDALTLQSHEANNVAFLVRQMGREKAKHEGLVKEREDENVRRKKQGLGELPSVGEMRGGTRDPSRLELLCLQGSLEGLGKGMGEEAGKGLVRCYL